MDQALITIIQKNLHDGPADLRTLALSDEFSEKVTGVIRVHNLARNDGITIKNAALLVLAGVMPPAHLQSHLMSTLSMPLDAARRMAEDLDMALFAKVRPSLDKIYAGVHDEPAMPGSLPPPPPPPGLQKNTLPVPPRMFPQTPTAPRAPLPNTPPPRPAPTAAPIWSSSLTAPTPPITTATVGNIVADKLTVPVTGKATETTISTPPPPPPSPGYAKVDPYREPAQ